MRKKEKKYQISSGILNEEKIEVKIYTIKELLELGNKTNTIEIAPNILEGVRTKGTSHITRH